jgi:hypothetical protein
MSLLSGRSRRIAVAEDGITILHRECAKRSRQQGGHHGRNLYMALSSGKELVAGQLTAVAAAGSCGTWWPLCPECEP